MGVRGLETFVRKYCNDACYTVSIPEIVDDYKKRNKGKPVVIVVDGYSWCFNWLQITTIETICGADIQRCFHRIERFVQSFRNLNVKLVFFFDGAIENKKMETYLRRRRDDLLKMVSIFQALENKETFDIINQNYSTKWIRESLLYAAVKSCGCEVYHTVHDCDEEIMLYAQEHKCFAIMGQDTDFLIPNIDSVVLFAQDFNIDDMTTLLCDRQKLAISLGLYVSELPLFATILGNDYMPWDDVKEFHCTLTKTPPYRNVSYEILMPAVAKYVRSLSRLSIQMTFDTISGDIFNTTTKADLIKCSYDSYQLLPFPVMFLKMASGNWLAILLEAEKRHRTFTNPDIILNVLKDLRVFIGVRSENMEKINNKNKDPRFLPASTITRILRQRLYGLLLMEHEKYPKITITEYCCENVESYNEPVCVKLLRPLVSHPGLMTLWKYENNTEIVKAKWRLFVRTISPNFGDFDRWISVDADVLLAAATLIYLFEEKYLSEKEVMVLIGTIVTSCLYDRKRVQLLSLKKLDIRAVHIYTTFTMTFKIVYSIFATCGFPNPASKETAYMHLEPKVFHNKYKQMFKTKGGNPDQKINLLCENNADSQKKFYKIKKLIFANTKTE